jgi:preprotein translocase subunit SecF
MEKVTATITLLIIVNILFVCNISSSSGEWGDINSNEQKNTTTENTTNENTPPQTTNNDEKTSTSKSNKYTINFYLAIIAGIIGIIIILFLLYSIVKSPGNSWKSKKNTSK